MKLYECVGEFSFTNKAATTQEIQTKLNRAFKEQGFKEVNFEIKITRLTKRGQEAIEVKGDIISDKEKESSKPNLRSPVDPSRAKRKGRKTNCKQKTTAKVPHMRKMSPRKFTKKKGRKLGKDRRG